VIQACGRVVRAPDDYGATYLADSSLVDLFERTRRDMPDWFADQVRRTTTPDLPAFDPAAALAGVDADVDRSGGRSGRPGRSDASARAGRSAGSSSGSSASGRRRSSSGADAESGSGSGAAGDDGRADHPLSDVWGDS
jgi:hypothetical protein